MPELDSPRLTPAPLRGWRERFRAEHIGLLLTLAYLYLAGVGMLHEALVFAVFRINIISFAEPSDFILAAIRDPLVVLVSLAAFPLVAAFYAWQARMNERNANKPRRWWSGSPATRAFIVRHFSTFFVSTLVLYALAFSLQYAAISAKRLRNGDGQHVTVQLVADPGHPTAPDTTQLLLLGTTQKFVFLYDPVRRTTAIVPSSNIARLVVNSARRNQPAPGVVPAK